MYNYTICVIPLCFFIHSPRPIRASILSPCINTSPISLALNQFFAPNNSQMQMNSPVFRHQVSSLMDVGGASSLPDFNVDDAMTFYASSTGTPTTTIVPTTIRSPGERPSWGRIHCEGCEDREGHKTLILKKGKTLWTIIETKP